MIKIDPSVDLGVVVIGRNEGVRLQRCLRALDGLRGCVVYVDSGSTDGSLEFARGWGAQVLDLDVRDGFTAAKARNVGWRFLAQHQPLVRYVQFVDGDCELQAGWLQAAAGHLDEQPQCAGVCGRLRERYPDATLYNGLCDLEWAAPSGVISATGGIAMYRLAALQAVEGFRGSLIAGEEPELGVRLRAAQWSLYRLNNEMAWHDADMRRWQQWWRRATRTGHAYAEGNWLHGGSPHHHYDAEVKRLLIWGAVLPLVVAALLRWIGLHGLLLLLVYPLQFLRLWWRSYRDPDVPSKVAGWQAFFFVLGRFAEIQGWCQFHARRLRSRRSALIEYK